MQNAEQIMFFSEAGVVSKRQFNAELGQLKVQLAQASVVCNLHQDRYRFALGLVAAVVNNRTTVLPPSLAPEAIHASIADAPFPVILSRKPEMDQFGTRLALEINAPLPTNPRDYTLDAAGNPTEIQAFSSGSTSAPKSNAKTWDMLVGGAGVTHEILQKFCDDPSQLALLGTTPHGHMYGLEATIFAALGYGYSTYRGTIFYPADLDAAVEAARECGFSKLVLVTSPAHLRFLEAAILATPEIVCVLSATAPFPPALASRLTKRANLRVMEIYGSTETGSMALRETAIEETWQPSAGFCLGRRGGQYHATAPHLPGPVPIEDEIDLHSDGKFTLLGRTGDMVNVRGKSTRLMALNAILSEVPEISDGIFVHLKSSDTDHLAIVVVPKAGEGLSAVELRKVVRQKLLRHLDAAFVPKKVLIVEEIPRSATGKLTRKVVEAFLRQAGLLK